MGIRRSLSRRWLIARDFPARQRTKVFFASKAYRSELWSKKLRESRQPSAAKSRSNLSSLAHQHLNYEWYATFHCLSDATTVEQHFFEHGLSRGYAPSPEFSNSQGMLPHWGWEYFARLGFPVGQNSTCDLLPGDPEAQKPFEIRNTEKKPLAVVSANFGNYDRLLPVRPEWSKNADFFLLTDKKFLPSDSWRYVHANYFHPDPRRRARFVKTHLPTYFSRYERVMWVDGNILLCRDPYQTLLGYNVWDRDFATFRHWQRSSLVGEAAACVKLGKDVPSLIGAHLAKVSDHPAFEKHDLFGTMVMMMNPQSEMVQKMSSAWWSYIMSGSKRDQLSLPLAIHDAAGLDWDVFPETSIEMSPHFVRISH